MEGRLISEGIQNKIDKNKENQHRKKVWGAFCGVATLFFLSQGITAENLVLELFNYVVGASEMVMCAFSIFELNKLMKEEKAFKFIHSVIKNIEQAQIDGKTKELVVNEGNLITEIDVIINNECVNSSVIDKERKIQIAEEINPDGTKLYQWADLETGKIEEITENIYSMTADKLYDIEDQHGSLQA
ncbi:MAG TPA: hypothetical protein DCP90_03450 [Clostridiales bacterium]|nr:MAG: hypothetical protein A2Y22_03785 [Clostridiales bacterium GWD2_32_59]HAN09651.1 hypothetical protein [Clostridiales bacterium]